MKKLITLLLALLFILTACAPAAVEEAPTPVETPEPTVEATPEPTPEATPEPTLVLEDKDKVIYLFAFPETVPYGSQAGFENCMNENGIEYEMIFYDQDERTFDELLEYCINDTTNNKVVVMDVSFGIVFLGKCQRGDELAEKWINSGIKTIYSFTGYGYDGIQETAVSLGHTVTYVDGDGAAKMLAEYTAQKLDGKTGTLHYATIGGSGTGNPIEQKFREEWEALNRTYEIGGLEIEWVGTDYEIETTTAILDGHLKQNPNTIAVITSGGQMVGSACASLDADLELVVDANASEEDLALLMDGKIDAILDFPYYEWGYQTGLTAVKALNGEAVEQEIKVPYELLTQDNAQAYYDEHFA